MAPLLDRQPDGLHRLRGAGIRRLGKRGRPLVWAVLDDAYFMATVFVLATATVLVVIRRGHVQAVLTR